MVEPSKAIISEKLKKITLLSVEYEQKELGRGAYGTVYTAKYDRVLFAAKMVHPILVQGVGTAESEAMKNSFIRECCQCSDLTHPNIVTFIGIHYPDQSGIPVMIMELMDESLTTHIDQNQGILLKEKVDILIDVARGLGYLHAQTPTVLHRDLSPNNILLKKRKTTSTECLWIAKLADMGVAKAINVKAPRLQKLTKAPGTADFMPPEVLADNPSYDTSLDVFSYGGVMLYVASHVWPTPTEYVKMDPVTKQIVAITEVERRQKYFDILSEELQSLKDMAVSCLNNIPDERPTVYKIVKELELYKQMIDNPKLKTSSSSLMTVCLAYEEAEALLEKSDDGVFLLREMKECNGKEYEICLRWKEKTHHIKIFDNKSTAHCDDGDFNSIADLVQYYHEHTLGLPGIDTTLKSPLQGDCTMHTIEGSPSTLSKTGSRRSGLFGFGNMLSKLTRIRSDSTDSQADSPTGIGHSILNRSKSLDHGHVGRCYSLTFKPKASTHETTTLEMPKTAAHEIDAQKSDTDTFETATQETATLERSLSTTSNTLELKSSSLYEPISRFMDQNTNGDAKTLKCPSTVNVTASDKIIVEKELWYYGDISRAIAVQLLKTDGDFLLRYTKTKRCFVLTCKWNGLDKHFIARKLESQGCTTFSFEGTQFSNVGALIKYHVETQIPITKQTQAVLRSPVCRKMAYPNQSLEIITHENIVLNGKPMGKGFLGETYTAILKDSGNQVCVKCCFSNNSSNKQLCLNEAEVLKRLNHHNIVKLLGVCTDKEPMYIVTESLPGGNFLDLLQKTETKYTSYRLLRFSLDAAQGMEYVVSQKYIHRDLAARNCWIDRNLKISGFGLCRKAEDGHCSLTLDDSQAPAKWTAPEVFNTCQLTSACDVWSYGVLLYEVYSSGSTPYPGMKNAQARQFVEQGHRMEAPESTPKEVYDEIMSKCWLYEPEKRPTFSDIVAMLKTTIAKLIE